GEIDGDHILAVCALALHKEGKLAGNTVVGTVMSNMGLEKTLKQQNIQLEKTGVGDRYVLEQMLTHKYTIGGEKSGHIIFLNYNTTGDGMLSALQLLRAKVKSGLEMSKLVSVMRNMPQVMVNVIVENASKNKFNEYKEVAEAITDAELRLGEKGRVLVRASGTEPLIRIMLEGENKGEINTLALNIAEKMVKAMNAKIKK
ncbi:MAG: phosphoglucosamine mutase, partial [Clostridiales bacterium]|nr:phosphoglucosamine mutase [Clostridiales bacterium]